MTKRERLLSALEGLCSEEYGRGWNTARAIYESPSRHHAFEKELGERERKGYKLGYDLGQTDGFYSGKERGVWEAQKTVEGLTRKLTIALEGDSKSYQNGYEKGNTVGHKHGYDKGHSEGFDRGQATVKAAIEEFITELKENLVENL